MKTLVIVSGLIREPIDFSFWKSIPNVDIIYASWYSSSGRKYGEYGDVLKGCEKRPGLTYEYDIDEWYNILYGVQTYDMDNPLLQDQRWGCLQILIHSLVLRDHDTSQYDNLVRARWDVEFQQDPSLEDIEKVFNLVCDENTAVGIGAVGRKRDPHITMLGCPVWKRKISMWKSKKVY